MCCKSLIPIWLDTGTCGDLFSVTAVLPSEDHVCCSKHFTAVTHPLSSSISRGTTLKPLHTCLCLYAHTSYAYFPFEATHEEFISTFCRSLHCSMPTRLDGTNSLKSHHVIPQKTGIFRFTL